MNVQFSVVVKDETMGYGAFFGRFEVTLDKNGFFIIQWLKSLSGYKNTVRFKAKLQNGGTERSFLQLILNNNFSETAMLAHNAFFISINRQKMIKLHLMWF
jgi:hypothetical protein